MPPSPKTILAKFVTLLLFSIIKFFQISYNRQNSLIFLAAMETETEMLNTYFTNGAEVEISSDEDGFRGAWYEGIVVRPIQKKQRRNKDEDDDDDESSNKLRVLVEYKTLMADKKGKRPLKEAMTLVQLRPRPPPERRRKFEVSDEVDAYYNDGWWEGVVMELSGDGKYSVFFRGTRDQLEFEESQIRIHREWANGKWTPSFGDEGEEKQDEKVRSSYRLRYEFLLINKMC